MPAPRLSQVTIAIIGVGTVLFWTMVTIAALGVSCVEVRLAEIRAEGESWRAEMRADREAFQLQMEEPWKRMRRLIEGQRHPGDRVEEPIRERQNAEDAAAPSRAAGDAR